MAKVIDLDGLPDEIAHAISEDVVDLKRRFRENAMPDSSKKPLAELPTTSGAVIGSLSRADIYDER